MGKVKDHTAIGKVFQKTGFVVLVGTLTLGIGCRNEEVESGSQDRTSGAAGGVQPELEQPAPLAVPQNTDAPPVADNEFAVDVSGSTQFDQPSVPSAAEAAEPVVDPAADLPVSDEPIDPIAGSSIADPAGEAFDEPTPAEPPIQTTEDFLQTPEPNLDAPAVASTYTIQSGDDYSTIADRLWSDQSKWVAIQKANPDVDPRRLKIGQVINIPSLDTDALRRSGELSSAADAAAVGQTTTVTVEPGDSLSSISAKVYGSESHWEHIYKANKGTLSTPDSLKVGMTIAIPPKPERLTRSGDSKPASSGFYIIQPGDSLSSIAKKQLGSTTKWREIYEANVDRLDSPEDIKIGQKIRLPGQADSDDDGFQTK